ncbi:helix-turn-helix domain-containing protein [Lacticaseibacillus jixiensis]|jgi:predicted transcriptional regulator|uniref:helix-turn-helix domain-containing protein n=1 Tax=Lacticaseibacillus jixiensis TaxID=3231926 RepID=UPI0036F39AC2
MTGYEIRNRRLALGLSQSELSDKSGVPQSTICTIETTTRNAKMNTLNALGKVLGFRVVIEWK